MFGKKCGNKKERTTKERTISSSFTKKYGRGNKKKRIDDLIDEKKNDDNTMAPTMGEEKQLIIISFSNIFRT